MAVVINDRTFFPRRLSQYCPAMQYSAAVNYNGVTRVLFGAPLLADPLYFLNAQSVNVGLVVSAASMLNAATIPDPYGRTLQFVASGANATVGVVDGWDYLVQPMSENFTFNGATPVLGQKAFKYIKQMTFLTAAGVTVNVGLGARLGLPYKAIKAEWETADQVLAAAGTLAAPVLTDPATATTGDPRGLYTPTTALNGVKVITAAFDFINDVNAANNGGLHGIAHFTN